MSQIILTKDDGCGDAIETTVTITSPTQFTLISSRAANIKGTVLFNGSLVGTISPGNPIITTHVAGEHTVILQGNCNDAQVCIDELLDEGASSGQVNSDVLVDCAGTAEQVQVNQIVSLAGSERPLTVRVLEGCNDSLVDYEMVCASTDGRLLILNTSANPPELTELDGTSVLDGATAVNCDIEYINSDRCFQDILDNSIRYTRVFTYPVGSPSDNTIVWFDSTGSVIAEPVDVEPCAMSDTVATILNLTSFQKVSGSGAQVTPGGLYKVSFSNVGAVNALVHGTDLLPGEDVTYEGYLDPSTGEFRRLDEIPYDDNGSILSIAITP